MVDVSNPDEKLRPGMTATVTLDGSRRENAVRIPNDALLFRPSLEVMRSVRQAADSPAPSAETADDPAARRVWRFDGVRFTPIDVHVGLADGQWTELMSGPLRPGDALVTSASLGTPPSR
jgi:HlyD family secretion protein